jgi:hypothetical protein
MLDQHCLLAKGDIGAPIYWRTVAPYAITNGAPNPKIYKPVRYKVHIKITYWRAEQKEADRTFWCAAPIFIPIAY